MRGCMCLEFSGVQAVHRGVQRTWCSRGPGCLQK